MAKATQVISRYLKKKQKEKRFSYSIFQHQVFQLLHILFRRIKKEKKEDIN